MIDEEEELQFEQQKQNRIIIALRLKKIPYLEYSLKGEDIVANDEFFGRIFKSTFFPNICYHINFVKLDYPHGRKFHYISKTAWLVGVYTWLLSTNNCHLVLLMKKAADAVADIDQRMKEQGIKPPQLAEQDELEERELRDLRQRLCAVQRQHCEREEAEDLQLQSQFREQCLQEQYDEYELQKRQARQQRRLARRHQTEQEHLILEHQQRQLQGIHLGEEQQYHQLQINPTQRERETEKLPRRGESTTDRRHKALQRLQELQQDPEQYQQAHDYLNPSIMRGYPHDQNRHQ